MKRVSNTRAKKDIHSILKILILEYPDAKCGLTYKTPFELLIATILSAQTTDIKVNKVTSKLFSKYKSVYDIATLSSDELEDMIKELGLYRNKTKSILETVKRLIDEHDGEVPKNRKDLQNLAGVGRKTANVILSTAFDIPALAVDTHVFRVTRRLGLTDGSTPIKVEEDLMEQIPKSSWTLAHHLFIYHGRSKCLARNPKCEHCPLSHCCNYYNNL